jgi:hypothetical protein|tara:strand:- start:2652 stop:3350 length:699 start_codon:yes stop_codon:yes gene_type:complete
MATIKVIDVISRVEAILQDSNVRWPRLELQRWINEAYLSIVLLRPDANAKCATFTCAAGTKQTLTASSGGFPTAIRLLDIKRNLASSSSKKVVRVVAQSVLDDQRPSWHTETQTASIQHYTYDPRNPKDFYVYPPAASTAQLEVVYVDTPSAHALSDSQLDPANNNTAVILVDDIYLGPITDWILYRAYSKDAEHGANEARASAAFQTFNAVVGTKTQVDAAVSPSPGSKVA